MKRFLYEASIQSATGTQVFYIDAGTQAEADARAAQDDTDGMYQHEAEVQSLSDLTPIGETSLTDFGDFPPDQPTHPSDTDGWGLADKVRAEMDRECCPSVWMNIAVEAIVKHYAAMREDREGS